MVIKEEEIKKAVDVLLKSCRIEQDSFGLDIVREFDIGGTRKRFSVNVDIVEETLIDGNWVNKFDEIEEEPIEEIIVQ
ncbi:MAG: hypothetical protein PF569_01950 [Candidatus Woesearchaeota archaeon]|nr:hypothetical protein [Candidatus Woesearchaeota archaeon]